MKTTSLELSKELKETGYPQENGLYWILDTQGKWTLSKFDREEDFEWIKKRGIKKSKSMGHVIGEGMLTENLKKEGYDFSNLSDYYASPTADEILEQLPGNTHPQAIYEGWYIKSVWYEIEPSVTKSSTLADAAAKMWLYLKKEKLI